MAMGTAALQAGRLDLESIVRAPLVGIADPGVIAAGGHDVDPGDGSAVRARMHRGRARLGLIVVAHAPLGQATVAVGGGASAVSFPTTEVGQRPLPLAG